MARYALLQTFYASDSWRKFRLAIIAERGLRCEYCGSRVATAEELTLHHIQELTLDNYQDAEVALNPTNIMVVHSGCHNKLHNRSAGPGVRQVFLVYGPPLAGKHTFVRERSWPGDLIVDIDLLYRAVSGLALYDKPDRLLPNVRAIHSTLLDNVRTRYGKWDRAWIIGGYADKYRREKQADDLGAELVKIEASEEECLTRLRADEKRAKKYDEWAGYIKKWFESYTP